MLKQHIFRAYDIRGIYGDDFDANGFGHIATAFVQWLKREKMPHGRMLLTGDVRTHTPQLLRAVYNGLTAAGVDVVYGGLVPTPITLLCLHTGEFDASLQITASHNGKAYNGMKLSTRDGSICGEDLQAVYGLVDESTEISTEPLPQKYDAEGEYIAYMKANGPQTSPLHMVIDAGNGIAGEAYPRLFRALGHTVTKLFCELDGEFPNHQPDPEDPANLVDLQAKVVEVKADIGFAYDGDGDRVGVVLRDGTALTADHILYVLAADYLSRNPGAEVVLDIMCSAALANGIQKMGGKVVWSPTGHSNIEYAMKDHKALLGGEQSGHFMFAENFFGHDDAALAAWRFMAAVEADPTLIAAVMTQWPQLVEYSEKRVVNEAHKFAIIEEIQQQLSGEYEQAVTIDGVRIDWPDGSWGIVRASNTSPKISVRVQAASEETLSERAKIFADALTVAIEKKSQ